MGLLCASCAVLVGVLLPTVTAARGGGGNLSTDNSSNFVAPPLEIANLGVYGLLLFVTLILLAIASPALSRAGSRLPAAGVVAALICMNAGYALSVAEIVINYTVNNRGIRIFPGIAFINLQTANSLFLKWPDPALFLAVLLILYNRYCTVQEPMSCAIVTFSIAGFALFMSMAGLVAAQAGLIGSTVKARLRHEISSYETAKRLTTSNSIYYTFIAFHLLSTFFLAVVSSLVKNRIKKDTVTSLTTSAIVPLLLLHALARLALAIVATRLPLTDAFTPEVAYILDLTSTAIYGLLYTAATTLLVYLLARTRLWSTEPRFTQGTAPAQGAPLSQYIVEGIPPAQFPGQWGHPQPTQGPYLQYPQYAYPQQYAYAPVFPA